MLRKAAAAAADGVRGRSRRRAPARGARRRRAGRRSACELSRLHAELASYLRHASEHDESDEELRLALELLPEEAELERARLRAQKAKGLMLRGHFREAAVEAAAAAKDARRLGAVALETAGCNTEGFARAALGETEEGARLLREARDLAAREGPPAGHARAVVNLSEMLDLSGRTEDAVAEVRAALPIVREHAEPSVYDAFLELQLANQLLRLGRTAEAAAALPDRIPGDAVGTTAMFLQRRACAARDPARR